VIRILLIIIAILVVHQNVLAETLLFEKIGESKVSYNQNLKQEGNGLPLFFIKDVSQSHVKARLNEVEEIKEKIIYPLIRENLYAISVIVIEFKLKNPKDVYLEIYSGLNTYSGAFVSKSNDGSFSKNAYKIAIDDGP
jgi:hypothetical protein